MSSLYIWRYLHQKGSGFLRDLNLLFALIMIFSIPHNKRVKLRNFEPIGRKGGHRIEHTIAKKHRHHITSSKIQIYISLNFNSSIRVSTLTLIRLNLSHLFDLIQAPIITIEWVL